MRALGQGLGHAAPAQAVLVGYRPDALRRYLPHASVLGAAAGVHLTVTLPAWYHGDELVARAAAVRVKVEPLAPSYLDQDAAPPGLILGYANLTEGQIVAGIQALADALRP